jgi:hypothetical protein
VTALPRFALPSSLEPWVLDCAPMAFLDWDDVTIVDPPILCPHCLSIPCACSQRGEA